MSGVYSVSQINRYIQGLFTRDFVLSGVRVQGEVSNCKHHSSGHIYFTLKDENAAISCILFASRREALSFRLQDGQEVEAAGRISVYEKTGSYQLYADSIRLSGRGELYERFLERKARLEEMGMFDALYKKPIPPYVQKLGIVTAETGAAIRDIINVTSRRNPYMQLYLCPARVQGEGAAESIAAGIRRLDRLGLDVIIIGRGGGSIEDLWAFNEEVTARAVFDARTPIISAVGHETDFSITDFVADLRAPTPSAAAELASFEYDAFVHQLMDTETALQRALEHKAVLLRRRLSLYQASLEKYDPKRRTEAMRKRLSDLRGRMSFVCRSRLGHASSELGRSGSLLLPALLGKLKSRRTALSACAGRLEALSPLKKLSGGYGYVTDGEGRPLRSIRTVRPGMDMVTRLRDGSIRSRVESVNEEG